MDLGIEAIDINGRKLFQREIWDSLIVLVTDLRARALRGVE